MMINIVAFTYYEIPIRAMFVTYRIDDLVECIDFLIDCVSSILLKSANARSRPTFDFAAGVVMRLETVVYRCGCFRTSFTITEQ